MHYKDAIDPDKTVINEINNEVENFVYWIFQHHEDSKIRGSKVIHDGVWGTHIFKEIEVSLINTPLIQRLRQIHQTAYSYLTYPSTQHTRFEHTIGVASQTGNLFKALKEKFEKANNKKDLIDENFYRTLRIASIFHDCGHGPFSHSSEEIYGNYKEIKLLQQYDPFKSAKPHEIFSYLILDSEHFKKRFTSLKDTYGVTIDDNLMKYSIVGYVEDPSAHYKIDMLNGPFDADKLDYLFRDGHFSGLPLQIDLDRLWFSLDVNTVKDDRRRLTIDWGGVCSLEQILFSKMTLYPAVYHHHKVRTCDCMFKGIIEYIKEKGLTLTKNAIDLKKATNFLYLTDPEIFGMHGLIEQDENLHNLIHNLQYRRLLKRAVIISRDTVVDKEKLDNFTKFMEKPALSVEGYEYYRWLAKKIWEEAGSQGLLQEIWVDCPDYPSFNEANDTFISPLGEGQESFALTEFFKTEQYANQYKQKKWRSHVFCKPEYVDRIAAACVAVFHELFQIEFKPLAFQLCHVIPPHLGSPS